MSELNEAEYEQNCLWIWYGAKATSHDKQVWKATQKAIGLAGDCDENIREVYDTVELKRLETSLIAEGWEVRKEGVPAVERLKFWVKQQNSGNTL